MSQLHGEVKIPGGKLVVVHLDVESMKIAEARISGDFFFHPESRTTEVMEGLCQQIRGLPLPVDIRSLAARLEAAIPFGVELLGTSPQAIAQAVGRALGDAHAGEPGESPRIGSFSPTDISRLTESWRSYAWRIIPETPLAPAMNVALDETLTDEVASGRRQPTLRFWRWAEPAVILGRCQSVANEVDEQVAKEMGIRIVRRMTGGGAMFLQPHGAITYSLYLPEAAVEGLSIRQSYEICESWIIEALRGLGVDAHHVPINDIACSEGKIGGAAQARRRGVVLHHTTMAYDMDPGEMVRVLRIGREKLKDKGVASAARRVSPLVRQTGLSREAVVDALMKSFQNRFGGAYDEMTGDELARATELVAQKYAHPSWLEEFP